MDMSVRLLMIGLMAVLQLIAAENIAPKFWTISNLRNTALSNYTQEEPLRNFVDVKNNSKILLKHPAFVVRACVGSVKASPGTLDLNFKASNMTGETASGRVMVDMYGYHFREDGCTGKIEPLHWQEAFSVSGEKDICFQFPISDESLQCLFCDEPVPTFRFFIAFVLTDKSPAICLEDINISTEAPLFVYGKKQIGGASWLVEELEKDKDNDAVRATLHGEQKQDPLRKETVTTVAASPQGVKDVPERFPVAMEQFISKIEAKMPALFDGFLNEGALVLEKTPSNGWQSIAVFLNPPEIPEGFEYVVTMDQNGWSWCKGIYDKEGRPLKKRSGYLSDGTMIMRLPRECRRIDFKCCGNQNASGVLGKVFYRKIEK